MSPTAQTMPLGIEGFTYADLYAPARLKELHDRFCRDVAAADPAFWAQWDAYRTAPDAPRSPVEVSDLIVRMAPHLSRFVEALFRVDAAAGELRARTHDLDELFRFKVDFVRKRSLPLVKGGAHVHREAGDAAMVEALIEPFADLDRERAIAAAGCRLLDREVALRADGRRRRQGGTHAADRRAEALVRLVPARPGLQGVGDLPLPRDARLPAPGAGAAPAARAPGVDDRPRRPPAPPRRVRAHRPALHAAREPERDPLLRAVPRARQGLVLEGPASDKAGAIAPNPLGIPLAGCPLDEKISEMHMLRKGGDAIGALAIIVIDNPMVAGTGHRICNDCMKACIYQKQEPVNIPQIETGVLTDVLQMPYGVEIYGLLTRWNPLNVRRPYALPYNGRNILVVGLGPAGYTLAHYLLNEGFGVVAIDGLKIEPLPPALTGEHGEGPQPIAQWDEIYDRLDERVLEGFGGVSEYGITVRWDKNFLTLLHLMLARRDKLRIYGGIRFGGTLPIEDAWAHGFDHIAIAAGAGKPTVIDMKHNLVRGVRKASDFLMALQLTGAFKRHALPNLQARLPAIVIGGGLTGIDTATELFAYYPIQVEKTLERYEALSAEIGEAELRAGCDAEEQEILDEFLVHGRAVRAERARAAAAGEAPNFVPLVRGWGGVTLAYRKKMTDSPAYRLNHEEVIKALEEGIHFAEGLDPKEIVADERDHAVAMRLVGPNGSVELPARTVLVAAGTSPNITYEKEKPNTFQMDSKQRFFQGFRAERVNGAVTLTPDPGGFFTSYNDGGRLISYYGDNHPRYAGNVVKAMASAKHGYRYVTALFDEALASLDPAAQASREAAWGRLVATLDAELLAEVVRVERLTPTIVEVVVKAPAAARHFHPGQFYRLQNFEALAARAKASGEPPLLMEGIALTGAWVDKEQGLLSMIALEMGVSSRLIAYLKPGEPVVVMGPTGTPTEIPHGEAVLLAGGGLGNAVLFSIAKALKDQRQSGDLFRRLQEGRGPLQARGDRGVHRPGDLEHRHGRHDSPRAARKTRISAATSCRRWWPTPTASSARRWCRSRPCRASSPSGPIA